MEIFWALGVMSDFKDGILNILGILRHCILFRSPFKQNFYDGVLAGEVGNFLVPVAGSGGAGSPLAS